MGWGVSGGASFVTVVKPADLEQFDHRPEFRWLKGSGLFPGTKPKLAADAWERLARSPPATVFATVANRRISRMAVTC